MDLCTDLNLSIYREEDPQHKGREQIRVLLSNPLEMQEVQQCYQINVTTPESRRYHIQEAVVISLRRAVSEAFRAGLISDSLGTWKITKEPSTALDEIDLSDSML